MMSSRSNELRPVNPPRRLTHHERAVIDQLLAQPFAGRDALRAQMADAHVSAEGTSDSRTLVFRVADAGAQRAQTPHRVPVEAQTVDIDGTPIDLLLHVVDGVVKELEIYRVDGNSIQADELGPLENVFAKPS